MLFLLYRCAQNSRELNTEKKRVPYFESTWFYRDAYLSHISDHIVGPQDENCRAHELPYYFVLNV